MIWFSHSVNRFRQKLWGKSLAHGTRFLEVLWLNQGKQKNCFGLLVRCFVHSYHLWRPSFPWPSLRPLWFWSAGLPQLYPRTSPESWPSQLPGTWEINVRWRLGWLTVCPSAKDQHFLAGPPSGLTCSLRRRCWPRPLKGTAAGPGYCWGLLAWPWENSPCSSVWTLCVPTTACWSHSSPWGSPPTGPTPGSGSGTQKRRCHFCSASPPFLQNQNVTGWVKMQWKCNECHHTMNPCLNPVYQPSYDRQHQAKQFASCPRVQLVLSGYFVSVLASWSYQVVSSSIPLTQTTHVKVNWLTCITLKSKLPYKTVKRDTKDALKRTRENDATDSLGRERPLVS